LLCSNFEFGREWKAKSNLSGREGECVNSKVEFNLSHSQKLNSTSEKFSPKHNRRILGFVYEITEFHRSLYIYDLNFVSVRKHGNPIHAILLKLEFGNERENELW
jgi:hypothetical protein